MHDKSVYEFDYTDRTREQLKSNIIAENMLSQVECEDNHYQMLTEVTDINRYDSNITNVDGFIKYSHGNLHWKRKRLETLSVMTGQISSLGYAKRS